MKADLSAVTLRAARPDDALCLGVLATQVFLDTYATQGIRPAVAREVQAACATDVFAALIDDPGRVIEVTELDGHLIAFYELRLRAGHALAPAGVQAELCRLYVQEPFVGRGLGSALLRAAEARARDDGATVLWLTAWVHNRRALRFYAACGYADVGPTLFRFEGEAHENRVLAQRLPASSAGV